MYTPLYIKTDGSLLSSFIKLDELIIKAKNMGYKSLTITDNNMYNVMPFYKKCLENNIKPIIGLEIKIEEYTLVLYAKNYKGYLNLIKISSEEKNFELLKKYYQNLILIIPYESKEIKENLTYFEDIYISYSDIEEYQKITFKNKIYMNKILFLEPTEEKYLYYLEAIKKGVPFKSITKNKTNNFLRQMKTYEILDKTIENNYFITNMCNCIIEKENNLPVYDTNGIDSFTYLKEECKKGMIKRFGNTVKKIYQDRLKYELNVINKMGFCDYFLIVSDYVNFAKKNGILVGPGRGSAAGSLVSYVLNITDIDPIKYNLLFERFLNEMRITMPDIDIDFEFLRRDEVINYCINKYGEKRVAGIITFGTLGSKQAIRDVARCLEINQTKIDNLNKLIDSKISLKENLKNEKIKEILKDQELLNVYKISGKIEGIKRHTSIHAAGIVMSKKPLDEIVPLEKKNNMYISCYTTEFLEELGLLKMDFLALKTLTTIKNIIEEINKEKQKVDYNDIPLNDKKTLNIFYNADTTGIFQFESSGIIKFLEKFKPTTFEDIFACLALYRPGPMDNIDTYIKRKNNPSLVEYFDESLKPILEPTYGIMIYQEQIMQVASTFVGYTLGEADILRRAISKKKEKTMLEEKEKFINKAINLGKNKETAETIFNYILKFAAYGFNRSHSVSYAFISYKMAYLKANYPLEFMKSLLISATDSISDTEKYIAEAKYNNIDIIPPNINYSEETYTIKNNKIVYPLYNIKNITTSINENIIETRKKEKFKNIYDFISRVKITNRKVLESLILVGAFDEFNINRRTLIESLDEIINFGEVVDETYKIEPFLEEKQEYSKKELLQFEKEYLGFYLTDNPISLHKRNFKNIIPISKINEYYEKTIDTIIMVLQIREITTKNNKKMCFIMGSDETTSADFIVFNDVYLENMKINKNDILLVRGIIEKRFDKYQIIVKKIKILD